MNGQVTKPLYGKVLVKGIIRTLTGLHIGAGREGIAIGALDNPVIVEPVTGQPYIPGSSLKGKMRSLLERREAARHREGPSSFFNRDMGRRGFPIKVHVCSRKEDAHGCPVCRLFGSSGGRDEQGSNFPSRLRTRDSYLTGYSERRLREADTDLLYTEVKYENALDRITAAANPRPVERIPPDVDFILELVYDVENLDQLAEDLQNLVWCLSVLQDDYLGGMGSRGYGKVSVRLSRVVARKTGFYAGRREDELEVVPGREITRETSSPLEEGELKPVEELREAIERIVAFFQGEGA